jgi:hypothetical protein
MPTGTIVAGIAIPFITGLVKLRGIDSVDYGKDWLIKNAPVITNKLGA